MTTKEMIEILRYKANNIKAKIEPKFFNEVADVLEGKDINVTSKYNEWISVKDKLPEIKDGENCSDKILISTKKGDMFVGNYRKYKWCGDIYVEWCSYGTGGRRMKVMSKVLAWMPLPNAYKK